MDPSPFANLSGQAPSGTHFSHFYETADDLAACVVPFLKAGLLAGERCLWVTSPPLEGESARAALRAHLPDMDARIARGQLEMVAHDEWYRAAGGFDADAVLAGWLRKERDALDLGYSGLRITGNTFWLDTPQDFADFHDYETRLHQVLRGSAITCLCSYCLPRCSGSTILDVVGSHDCVVTRRRSEWEVVENATLKQAKQELAEALASREILLNEIHHRIKNNLQVVSSLLMLKAHHFREPAAALAVEDTLNRIHAMALVHEMLYRHDDSAEIAFGHYLLQLAAYLIQAYGMSDRLVLDVDDCSGVEGAQVPLDKAIPLGIAAAEIITNAIKHAFPGERRGTIRIEIRRHGDALTIHVADDGVGLDSSRLAAPRGGAGTGLVRGLMDQVGGSVEFASRAEGGTVVSCGLALPPQPPARAINSISGAHSFA